MSKIAFAESLGIESKWSNNLLGCNVSGRSGGSQTKDVTKKANGRRCSSCGSWWMRSWNWSVTEQTVQTATQ